MNSDEIKGKAQAVTGKVKQAVGRAIDDPVLENEGLDDETEGEARDTVGHARRKVGEAVESVGKAIKK